MQHRNVLSLVRYLVGASLGFSALTLSATASADAGEKFPLLSLLMPSSAQAAAAPSIEDKLTVHEIRTAPQPKATIDLTAAPDDLWERIRNGFAMTNLNDDLVLYYQQWYQSRPDALRRMVERSRPYLHHIVEELEARGMPTELALLPMVESSFNPMAYSRAHAAGLWQFIPATGKRFNLEQNWWQDQRRDVIASTGAALDYLQTIYDMHGDWHLALASYNWGEGAVKRAVEKNEARGLPTDYPSLRMPNETRHYVPKLQALKNIFGNPALVAQLGLPGIPNRPYFATLETPRPMDVKTAARLANMPVEEFQRLNPSHNRPIIKPDTPLVIPADKVETFNENLQNTQAPLTQWQAYTLKSADRLEQLAKQFDISVGELARANGLPEKARLAAGTTLLVPGGGNGDNLAPLLNAQAPAQFIQPEPQARPCKPAKRGKASTCSKPAAEPALAHGSKNDKDKTVAKAGGKDSKSAKASSATKSAKTAHDKPSKSASATASKAAPSKVAKSSNNRRG